VQYALSYICVFYSIDKRHLLVETNETAPSVDYLDKKKMDVLSFPVTLTLNPIVAVLLVAIVIAWFL